MPEFSHILPYVGAGGGGVSISFLIYRIKALESKIKVNEREIKKQRKRTDLIYLYLTRKDTNFGDFLRKHNDNF